MKKAFPLHPMNLDIGNEYAPLPSFPLSDASFEVACLALADCDEIPGDYAAAEEVRRFQAFIAVPPEVR